MLVTRLAKGSHGSQAPSTCPQAAWAELRGSRAGQESPEHPQPPSPGLSESQRCNGKEQSQPTAALNALMAAGAFAERMSEKGPKPQPRV